MLHSIFTALSLADLLLLLLLLLPLDCGHRAREAAAAAAAAAAMPPAPPAARLGPSFHLEPPSHFVFSNDTGEQDVEGFFFLSR